MSFLLWGGPVLCWGDRLGAKRGEVLGSTLSLALAMALERLDPSSRWQPYWHTLPR